MAAAMAGQYRDTDIVWKNEYLWFPSQWQEDLRNIKVRTASIRSNMKEFPDFNTTTAKLMTRQGASQRDVESCSHMENQIHQQGYDDEMFDRTSRMDTSAIVALLKSSANRKDLCKGNRLLTDIRIAGLLRTNVYVSTGLLNMYAKCGAFAKAREVFAELPVRNLVAWNALIAGYIQHEQGHEALDCFERMQQQGLSPDAITFTCILKACGSLGATEKGEEIHAEIFRLGLLEKDTMLGTALVDMYAKCGALAKAREVFEQLPVQPVASWNALIAGCAKHGHGHEALHFFEQMQQQGLCPTDVTLTCILKVCGSLGAAEKGEEIHAKADRQGLLEKNIILGTAVVDMYAKCGALTKAQEVFDKLPVHNIVSWSALITGYVQHEHGDKALDCFEKMKQQGISPDSVTFICVLKACGIIGTVEKGEKVHAEIVRQGLLGKNTILGTALVDMYAKCGALLKAREVFDELPVRNIVSWNALIEGYCQHGHGYEALNCFEQMQHEGLSPNAVTYSTVLKACGSVGAAEKGEAIHIEIVRLGWLGKDTILGTALVDMYAKCGALVKARELFEELPIRDVVSWNVLIEGYAQVGKVETVLNLFNNMIGEGIDPDSVTFTLLLNACSHTGLVDKGQMYFEIMSTSYSIIPTIDHHVCMVDLFGRAGHFDKAIRVIEKMPPSDSSDYLPLWSALMGACQKWGNVRLGRLAFKHAIELDEKGAAAYILMSNIYAAANMWDEANMIETMRVRNKAWKPRMLLVD